MPDGVNAKVSDIADNRILFHRCSNCWECLDLFCL